MQIHELKPNSPRKTKKRVGRGGKRGTTAGRGTKGQRAHGAGAPRPAIRDFLQRLPKLRGYKNMTTSPVAAVVNLDALNRVEGNEITIETLIKAGIIRKTDTNVKILSRGEVTKPVTITGIPVSAGAREKIEKAGGKIV